MAKVKSIWIRDDGEVEVKFRQGRMEGEIALSSERAAQAVLAIGRLLDEELAEERTNAQQD